MNNMIYSIFNKFEDYNFFLDKKLKEKDIKISKIT